MLKTLRRKSRRKSHQSDNLSNKKGKFNSRKAFSYPQKTFTLKNGRLKRVNKWDFEENSDLSKIIEGGKQIRRTNKKRTNKRKGRKVRKTYRKRR